MAFLGDIGKGISKVLDSKITHALLPVTYLMGKSGIDLSKAVIQKITGSVSHSVAPQSVVVPMQYQPYAPPPQSIQYQVTPGGSYLQSDVYPSMPTAAFGGYQPWDYSMPSPDYSTVGYQQGSQTSAPVSWEDLIQGAGTPLFR